MQPLVSWVLLFPQFRPGFLGERSRVQPQGSRFAILQPPDGSTIDADVKLFVPIISVTLLLILACARGLVLYECASVVQTMFHFV